MTKAKEKPQAEAPSEPTIFERLSEPFSVSVVEWLPKMVNKRDGKTALALAYIDARSVMARLDEVVGPQNWQDSYRQDGNRTICTLSIRLPDTGEWVSKSDGSGDSDIESEKGGISGAFKRAAVKWGIGRYLYDVDAVWADCSSRAKDGGKGYWFNGWTDAGKRMLDEALRRAPGPRQTGRPFGVDKMLELIREAKSLDALAKVWTAHWATIPLEFRKEVLEAKEAKKQSLRAQPDDDKQPRDRAEHGEEGNS